MMTSKTVLINDIHLPLDTLEGNVFLIAKQLLKKESMLADDLELSIYKKAIDARKKDQIMFVYTIAATGHFSSKIIEQLKEHPNPKFSILKDELPNPVLGDHILTAPILVVGAGPAGLFCTLFLLENGYSVHLIEQGGSVEERKKAVDLFQTKQVLDFSTNIQFGAGGAGTFSDGKLVTRIHDPFESYILSKFVEFGAPKEIQYEAKPHIGTDVLCVIISKMMDRILELGGKISYHTKMLSIRCNSQGEAHSVLTTKGELSCGAVVLALGNSARDTFLTLLKEEYILEPKPISVGVRVEHLQKDIDESMYGSFAGHPKLGPATYQVSYDTKNRGVYSFCMCPGGTIVAAASEKEQVVVNGMSYSKRDGRNANSAIVVSIKTEDYGNSVLGAISFQRTIEHQAFIAGGGTYAAPCITMGDFLSNQVKEEPKRILPTYMNGKHIKISSPSLYLPSYVVKQLQNGFQYFDTKIKGFAQKDALLTGAETRTSSPVRMLRDSDTRTAFHTKNIYPAGEGAGYAGGITSASLDGLRTALSIIATYKPNNLY